MDESKGRAHNNDLKLTSVLNHAGFINLSKMTSTLQGSIWRALEVSSNTNIVIKITSKYLHEKSMAIVNEKMHSNIKENICLEAGILKFLQDQNNVPKSIIKYHTFLQSHEAYFLIIDDGGSSLFDFIVQAHKLISMNKIEISEWHRVVKIIFKQMVEGIEYIHSKCISHFDISLENWVINDVAIITSDNNKIQFVKNDIQIKLIDFGLAEAFAPKNSDNLPSFNSNKFVGKTIYKSPENTSKKGHFNAALNDIFCIGICLFLMVIGSCPWARACKTDQLFGLIMNGSIRQVLKSWNKDTYVNDNIIDLLESFFQYEDKRIDIKNIKKHPFWKEE